MTMPRARWSLLGLAAAVYAACGESEKSNRDGAPAGGSDEAGAGVGARGGRGGAAGEGDGGDGADSTGGLAGTMGGAAGVTAGGRAGSSGQPGGTAGRGESGTAGSGPCNCTGLTGVRPDAMIICVNGACVLDPEDCRP